MTSLVNASVHPICTTLFHSTQQNRIHTRIFRRLRHSRRTASTSRSTSTTSTMMTTSTTVPTLEGVSQKDLDIAVGAVQEFMANDTIRNLPQRAIQAHVWHHVPSVTMVLSKLRQEENEIRDVLLETVSKLIYRFMGPGLDATLARAGLASDERLQGGAPGASSEHFDIYCLDSKERLYLLLQQYGWLEEFFRRYPVHFYENSFSFVQRVPRKSLPVTVKVVGCGIGGSIAASGLAKNGVQTMAIEKRKEDGPSSVTSRYQNASWRAYDIAANLVDEKAYQTLIENRQRINVTHEDGSTDVVESDRVQIIIGAAIKAALDSARRYGCDVRFESTNDAVWRDGWEGTDKTDIVALFCGTRTPDVAPGLREWMNISDFPDLDSYCKMWLRVKPSLKTDAYCTRGGEVGAEKWHYTIESARSTPEDIARVVHNLESQNAYKIAHQDTADAEWDKEYAQKKMQAQSTMATMASNEASNQRFDYIFTNAPANEHNLAKRNDAAKDGSVVLDGEYTVQVKMAKRCTITEKKLLDGLHANFAVCGGDACVPPNPMAAYGATLACEAAGSLVQLAVATGHLNAVLNSAQEYHKDKMGKEWMADLASAKELINLHYEARGTAENYFQFVQTLICNLYSLPPHANAT